MLKETNCGACGQFFNETEADSNGYHLVTVCDANDEVCGKCGDEVNAVGGHIEHPHKDYAVFVCNECNDDVKEFGTSRIFLNKEAK